MTFRSSIVSAVTCLGVALLLLPVITFAQKLLPDPKLDGKIFVFECSGAESAKDRKPYLNGLTAGGLTSMSPIYRVTKGDVSGTRWKIVALKDGNYGIKCLGDAKGSQWLDGWTTSGDVKLAPETDHNFTGTHWAVHDANGKYQIECRGRIEGPRFLDGNPGKGTLKLTKDKGEAGTFWKLMPSKAGSS